MFKFFISTSSSLDVLDQLLGITHLFNVSLIPQVGFTVFHWLINPGIKASFKDSEKKRGLENSLSLSAYPGHVSWGPRAHTAQEHICVRLCLGYTSWAEDMVTQMQELRMDTRWAGKHSEGACKADVQLRGSLHCLGSAGPPPAGPAHLREGWASPALTKSGRVGRNRLSVRRLAGGHQCPTNRFPLTPRLCLPPWSLFLTRRFTKRMPPVLRKLLL